MAITLKMARVGAGLTQAETAYKLGVHPQTYSKYEKNPEEMSIKDARKFCDICGVKMDDIFLFSNSN